MAVYTEQIQKLYVAYFNRPADYEGLAFWEQVLTSNGGNVDAVSAFFAQSPEYKDQNAGKSYYQIVNQIYLNLFNREADVPGLEHWSGLLRNGTFTVDQIVKIIADSASNTDAQDKTTYLNKVAAATAFTAELNTASEIIGYTGAKANEAAKVWLSTVLGTQASLDAAIAPAALANTVNKVAQTGLAQEGTTYTLTKGLDSITGTSGNDTIVGSIDLGTGSGSTATPGNAELNTLNNVDIINGGTGVDTFRIAHASGSITLGNVSNVEIIEIASAAAAGVDVDTSTIVGVTDLNIVKSAGATTATAANTTDVDVSMVDSAAVGTVTVKGAKDVNVVLTNAVSDIKVGAAGDIDPTGAISITATGAAAVNNATVTTFDASGAPTNLIPIEMGDITVGGGTTVSVTQKASVNTAGLVADGGQEKVIQGKVNITASAITTDITVKQDATISAQSRAAVTGVTEVATAKFAALKANESVKVGGLTFKAAKDLTAAEVAQAFANLSIEAITPAQDGALNAVAPVVATGDTNGSSVAANGTFSGSLAAGWSSGAANGDTVTFTGWEDTAMTVDLSHSTLSTSGIVTTVTQGVDAISARNRLGIDANTVTIEGGAALKTVTVDGYASSTGAAGINGTNAALTTVTLANGGSFGIDSAAATLTLNATGVNGTVTVTSGVKTIDANISNTGSTSTALASGSAEILNVKGAGTVTGTTATGGLEKATAINTTGMTGGVASFTINSGTVTSYTGGAASDRVTVSNADTSITKAINLGAGNDRLIFSGTATAVVPTATLSGGEGVDQIRMNGASAAALSQNGDFAAKIDGFERLYITDKVATATTVNMANMDGITYVATAGSTSATAVPGDRQTFRFDIAGMSLEKDGTLKVGGQTLATATANGTTDALGVAALIGTSVVIAGVTYDIVKDGTLITLKSTSNVAPQAGVSIAVTDGASPTNAGVITTPGALTVTGDTPYLTIDKMVNDSTVELTGASDGVIVKMADATGTADSLNIVTTTGTSDLNFGTVVAAGVETIKINAADSSPTDASGNPQIDTAILTLSADKATTVTIAGNSHIDLTLGSVTKSVATIDASTLTGDLTFAASGADGVVAVTVTGGSGNDTLTASTGEFAKADVLNGGAGNDVLYVGSNGAKLTGGEGNDLFIVAAGSFANGGTKEGNTYSEITDFKAGDLLQLTAVNEAGNAFVDVSALTKLAATLNESTAGFSNFVNAAIKEADAGEAVWFNYKGDLYVVVDSGVDSTSDVFANGQDLIVKLTGINGDNLTWNSDFGTAALI